MTKMLRDLIGKLAQGMRLLHFPLFKSLPIPHAGCNGALLDRCITNFGCKNLQYLFQMCTSTCIYFALLALQKDGIRT